MIRTFAVMTLLAAKGADAANTSSKNKPISKPKCNSTTKVSIRYSSSSKRLYLESANGKTRGGCVTLEDIWKDLDGSAPLYAVKSSSGDVSSTITGTWLLTESLYVEDGITLQVKKRSVCMNKVWSDGRFASLSAMKSRVCDVRSA